ncbi:MAG: AccI family restriction endonuclease [Armatimonadetes bacterium]|nr:AccI family restriction endonuclease [Armatimonadota bacterium]
MHPFEEVLSLSAEDIQFELTAHPALSWADFLLNPRRLRGSDFLMRWSQGQWSEHRLVQALDATGRYFALPYGPSGVAPDDDVRAFELYFERLERAGLGTVKRPDLLVFRAEDISQVQAIVQSLGGLEELPFTPEDNPRMVELLKTALVAVECENSLWIAKAMPDYRTPLTPQRRLNGLPGLKKTAVVPTVIVKDEDRDFLRKWQQQTKVPIHIWHAFYDMAFGLAFDDAEGLVASGKIEPTVQTFQAPGGATTQKVIYKFYYHYSYALGEMREQPRLVANRIVDKNGHILPYVRFEGGEMQIAGEAVAVLDRIANAQEG